MENDLNLSTLLFAQAGATNTEVCLQVACQRAKTLGLSEVVVASCSGETAYRILNYIDPGELNLIVVTHVTGFRNANEQEMKDSIRLDLEDKGCRVLTCAHAFGGVGRGLRSKLNTYQVDEVMAYTLRMFGQGVKVCVEISLMSADAGMVRTDQKILAIGGTVSGADTSMVITPANSHNCLELKIHEIICKPGL